MDKKDQMSRLVKEFLYNAGAMGIGIATLETLAGGPPSTDLTYVLPEAKSAVCFAVPLDQSIIEKFLNKKDAVRITFTTAGPTPWPAACPWSWRPS